MLLTSSIMFKRRPRGFSLEGTGLTFTSSWWLCIGVFALTCLFLSLGTWQAQRYFERQQLLELRLAQLTAPPLPGSIVKQAPDDSHLYARIALEGHFIDAHPFLFDNQIHGGQVGYRVLAPFQVDEEAPWVLVDRGWIPMGINRKTLPAISKTEKDLKITGTLEKPLYNRLISEPIESSETHWPLRIQNVDLKALSERLGHSLFPWVVQIEREDEQAFAVALATPWLTPIRHQLYALQWFSFIIILWSFWIRLNLRKKK